MQKFFSDCCKRKLQPLKVDGLLSDVCDAYHFEITLIKEHD